MRSRLPGILLGIFLTLMLLFGGWRVYVLHVRASAGAYVYEYLAAPVNGTPRYKLLDQLLDEQSKKAQK